MRDYQKIITQFKEVKPNFLIGTATSAHQVEGGNHNDWTEFEKQKGKIARGEKSGKACNHYEMYAEDFQMLKELGFKAHRLSIEWSRIVPEEGEINQTEIEHYIDVLKSLKDNNQLSFVTLHHFSSPIWFIQKGGFEKKDNLKYWKDYIEIVCNYLGEFIDVFNTINEPYVYAAIGYYQGLHSPGKKSIRSYLKVSNNLMRAHFQAVSIIRKILPDKKVGIVKNMIVLKPHRRWNPIDQLIKKTFDWAFNSAPLKALKKKKIPFGFRKIKDGDIGDFIGINHYNIMIAGIGVKDLMIPHFPREHKLTSMGWGVYPETLSEVLVRAYKILKLPIYITENGIGTKDDLWRQEVILDFLKSTLNAIKEGVDVLGYFYWSSIDNFEWAEGYLDGGFGLINVDFSTFKRTIKDSGIMLGEIAKHLY